jgi:hypothetical protein
MTIVDEKEILEVEKLKADYKKVLLEIERNPLDIQKMVTDIRHSSQRNVLLAVAVTTAIVSAYFKFLAA